MSDCGETGRWDDNRDNRGIMITAAIIGKGPTFCYHRPAGCDLVIAINEAAIAMRDAPDIAIASDWEPLAMLNLWRPIRKFQLAAPECKESKRVKPDIMWAPLPGEEDWRQVGRADPRFYSASYTSTAAVWLAWVMGAKEVLAYGIGGMGYHYAFEGKPGGGAQQGEQALSLLKEVCVAKKMGLWVDDEQEVPL